MKTAVLLSGFVLSLISYSASAQESTRDEFKEFCQAIQGRWIGDITWSADAPGLGKKGERVTTYWEGTITEDGNALLGKFYGGNGSGTWLIVFDAGTKQIKGLWITSGGSVSHDIIHKQEGKFVQLRTGSNHDGAKTESTAAMTLEENGSKGTWRGAGSVGGKKTDDFTEVWRRLSSSHSK